MPFPVAAVAMGAGALGSGIANFLGAQSANEQNWDQFVSNQAWNTNQITAARNYETMMSNTSWQRGVADMKAAGINPMVAFQQGGASTPSAPVTNAGVGNAAQNPMAGIGAGIQGAIAAVNLEKDLQVADADIALKSTQALTQAAVAEQQRAAAKSLTLETEYERMRGGKYKAEARRDESGAILDKAYQGITKLLGVVGQSANIFNSASGAVKRLTRKPLFPGAKGYTNIGKPVYTENDMLKAAKGKGVLVP